MPSRRAAAVFAQAIVPSDCDAHETFHRRVQQRRRGLQVDDDVLARLRPQQAVLDRGGEESDDVGCIEAERPRLGGQIEDAGEIALMSRIGAAAQRNDWAQPKKCSAPRTTLAWPVRAVTPGAPVPTLSSARFTPMRAASGSDELVMARGRSGHVDDDALGIRQEHGTGGAGERGLELAQFGVGGIEQRPAARQRGTDAALGDRFERQAARPDRGAAAGSATTTGSPPR